MSGETWRLNASNGLGGSQSSYFDNYAAQVGALDGSSGFDADLMGPGGSVFNGRFSGFGGGFSGGFGGAYSLYNDPTILAMTPEERMKYFAKMQKEQAITAIKTQKELDTMQWGAQVDQKHQREVAEFQVTAAEDVITRQCGILKDKIKENEQGHVAEEYTKLVQAVREKFAEAGYKNVDELQVRAYAEKLYYNATGVRLIEDIEKHSDSQFVTGLKQGASFGTGLFASNVSSKDNIAGMTGGEVSGRDKASKIAGNFLGVVTAGVVAVASFFLLKKGGGALLSKLLKSRNKPVLKELEQIAKEIAEKEGHLSQAKTVAASNANAESIVTQLETDIAALKAKKPELELTKLENLTGKSATRQQQGQTPNSNSSSPITPQVAVGTSAPATSTATTSGFSTTTKPAPSTPLANKPMVTPPVATESMSQQYTIDNLTDAIKLRTLAKKGNKEAGEVLKKWLTTQQPNIKKGFKGYA